MTAKRAVIAGDGVVVQLVAAGATVDPAWLNEADRGMPLEQMIRDDPRMRAALGGVL